MNCLKFIAEYLEKTVILICSMNYLVIYQLVIFQVHDIMHDMSHLISKYNSGHDPGSFWYIEKGRYFLLGEIFPYYSVIMAQFMFNAECIVKLG